MGDLAEMNIKKIPLKRNKNGTFAPGNAGGGRKPIDKDLKEALTGLVPRAVERLQDLVEHGEDDRLVMEAVKVIFDRVFGRPVQQNINDNIIHNAESQEQIKERLSKILDDLR